MQFHIVSCKLINYVGLTKQTSLCFLRQRGLAVSMNKKLNDPTNALIKRKTLAGHRRTLLVGILFTAICSLTGCGAGEALNSAIANVVEGKDRVQGSRAQTTKGQVYNCRVKSITGLEPSGMMEESSRTRALFTSTSTSFTFNETTGELRGDGFSPLKMITLQKGTSENTAIGYSIFKGSVSSGIAVLRIRNWEVGLPFLFLDSATLSTGSCESL